MIGVEALLCGDLATVRCPIRRAGSGRLRCAHQNTPALPVGQTNINGDQTGGNRKQGQAQWKRTLSQHENIIGQGAAESAGVLDLFDAEAGARQERDNVRFQIPITYVVRVRRGILHERANRNTCRYMQHQSPPPPSRLEKKVPPAFGPRASVRAHPCK